MADVPVRGMSGRVATARNDSAERPDRQPPGVLVPGTFGRADRRVFARAGGQRLSPSVIRTRAPWSAAVLTGAESRWVLGVSGIADICLNPCVPRPGELGVRDGLLLFVLRTTPA